MTQHVGQTLQTNVDLSDPLSFSAGVPHAVFAEMRNLPGLFWQPTNLGTANGGFWAITRFADIVAVERDPSTFTSTCGAGYPMTNQDPAAAYMLNNLMTNDPPRHTRLRKAAAAGFGPRVVSNLEPWVREIVHEVLEGLKDKREFDVVEELSQTIPALVIARVLGAPAEDRELIVRWTLAVFAATQDTEGLAAGEGTGARAQAMGEEQFAYVRKIRDYKRAKPADDMFTMLGQCVDRDEITEGEFLQWMIVMMGAGFETTHTAIGQALRMYVESPEVAAMTDRAVAEGMTDRAIDEYLRLITPAMQMARTATRDVELAGTTIRENDLLVLYFIAANHDAAFFKDPERFEPWRREKVSLAFGSGVHRCLGAFLAKLELRILFEALAERGIKLRLNGEPKRGWSTFINQLSSLPVARVD